MPGVGGGRAEPCAVPSGTGGSRWANNLWGLRGRGVFAHVVVSPCWDGDIVLKCQGCSALLAVVMPHGWDPGASCDILSGLQLSPGTSSHWRGLRDAQETFLHPSPAQAPPVLLQDAARSPGMLQDQLNPTGPSRLKEAQTITPHSLKQSQVLGPGTAPLASAFLIYIRVSLLVPDGANGASRLLGSLCWERYRPQESKLVSSKYKTKEQTV